MWDGVEVLIKQVKAVVFKYTDKSGRSMAEAPGALFTMTAGDDDRDQFYSSGGADAFKPSKDGKSLEPVGTRTSISEDSNLGKFIISLVEGGFPEDVLDDDLTVFEGVRFTGIQVPDPTDKKPDRTALRCDANSVKLPAKKGRGGKKGAAKAAAPADSSVDDEATGIILTLIAENDNSLPKKEIMRKAGGLLKELPATSKNAVMKLILSDKFLGAIDGVTYEDGILSM